MIRLLLLFKKIHLFLLFIALECIALYFFFNSTPYHRATAISASTTATGFINHRIANVSGYFGLQQENTILMEENARLRMELSVKNNPLIDSTLRPSDSTFSVEIAVVDLEKIIVARVIRNTYTKSNNFITLNKGKLDGMEPDMAIFNDNGIIGYTLRCSDHYSVAMSILNAKDFKVGGRLKNSDFTGSISWDGENYQYLKIEEMPKYADIKVGDTILTSYSNIFPDNLPIGTIQDFALTQGTFYNAKIKTFANMSNLGLVYAVKINNQQEREEIELSRN